MTTLNTQRTDAGVELTDDDGRRQGLIAYEGDTIRAWHVIAEGADPGRRWLTLEAAQFYALALYADRKK